MGQVTEEGGAMGLFIRTIVEGAVAGIGLASVAFFTGLAANQEGVANDE